MKTALTKMSTSHTNHSGQTLIIISNKMILVTEQSLVKETHTYLLVTPPSLRSLLSPKTSYVDLKSIKHL